MYYIYQHVFVVKNIHANNLNCPLFAPHGVRFTTSNIGLEN